MSRTRYRFLPDDYVPYFITATTVNWLPLFKDEHVRQILLDSLRFLIDQDRLTLHAYVILADHIHLIASAQDLSAEIASFKSFTAHQSLDYYKQTQQTNILRQLSSLKLAHKKNRNYQFWQEGSHPQRITGEKMMAQKVAYIHENPVRRGHVEIPENWPYSSAVDYAGGQGLLPVAWMGDDDG